MENQKKNNLLPIIVMIFLFGMISFVTNLASPMGDILTNQFGVPNWMGTLGVFANFIAYAIMGYPAGSLLQKRGYKNTALIAIAVGFAGVGIQAVSGWIGNIDMEAAKTLAESQGLGEESIADLVSKRSFGIYLLGAFVAGFSMCLLNTVVNPMLNKLGGGGNKGNQLIQTGGAFNSLCGTAVIIITGLLLPNGVKNAAIANVLPLMYSAISVFAFAFLVIFFTKIEENEKKVVVKEDSKYGPFSFRHFILGTVAIFVYIGIEVGIPNVLNKWLQNMDINALRLTAESLGITNLSEKELSDALGGAAAAIASSVTGTYWFLMLVGRLTGAALGSKISAKAMLTFVSTVGLVLVVAAILIDPSVMTKMPVFKGAEGVGFVTVPINALLLVLCGLCTSIMWGGIFNLAVEGLGKYTEKASGIFMVMVCGGGILTVVQNWLVDISGYLTSYWLIAGLLCFLIFYALVGCKNVNKDIPVE